MTDQELIAILEGGKVTSVSSTTPHDAINAVAEKHNINPSYLAALAKLETQSGDRMVGGTMNLFNVKDFSSKGGVAAYDKVEKSRDRYRQYQSYEHSVEDLVDLLKRKYPQALSAKSGQEFASALQKGGYATDKQYATKLTNVINNLQPSNPSISDKDLIALLEQPATQPTKKPVVEDTRPYRKGWLGEKIPMEEDQQYKPSPTSKVLASSALHSLTAGLVPEFTTEEERKQSPYAQLAGSVAGTLPYAFVPGGVPAQMIALGGRAGLQAGMEGKSGGDIATSAALEGMAPGVGAVVGKAVSLGGKALGGTYSAITPGTQAVRSALEKGLSKEEVAELYAKTRFPTIAPTTGTLSQAAQQTTANVAKQIESAVIPTQVGGAGVITMVAGIPAAITAGVAKGLVESVPQFPSLMKYVVRNLPKDAVRKRDYMWIVGEGAVAQGLTDVQAKAAVKAAGQLYDKVAERHLAQQTAKTITTTAGILSGKGVQQMRDQ